MNFHKVKEAEANIADELPSCVFVGRHLFRMLAFLLVVSGVGYCGLRTSDHSARITAPIARAKVARYQNDNRVPICPTCPPHFGLNLHISEYPGKRNVVHFSDLLVFEFRFEQYTNDTISADNIIFNLYELKYEFHDCEDRPYFSDKVDLSGKSGPGRLIVNPKIELPQFGNAIVIEAKLAYIMNWRTADGKWHSSDGVSEAFISISIISDGLAIDHRYGAYRRDLLRGNLLDIGRVYSGVWLKEYEPGSDPDDMLRFSRTFAPENTFMTNEPYRVYIPWTYSCKTEFCGSSVSQGSVTVYGSDENPLLRSGLVMATLALEAEFHTNDENLNNAVKILGYFEKSEYIDRNGERSGFFLRSPWPCKQAQNNCEEGKPEYWPMSTDEIVGMTLGLIRLHAVLKYQNPSKQLHEGEVSEILQRIEGLVTRLGTYLQNNHYIIVPPQDLPHRLYKGYNGTYAFQWFLQQGFHAITGEWFEPALLNTSSDFWQSIRGYSYVCVGDDDSDPNFSFAQRLELFGEFIGQGMPAHERAILTIQGTGIAATRDEFKRFNIPLLLHAFQIGMADDQFSDEAVKIKEKMAIFINGILGDPRVDGIDLSRAIIGLVTFSMFEDFFLWLEDQIPDWLTPGVKVGVGTCNSDPDLYAAAVALMYDLPLYYEEKNCPPIGFDVRDKCFTLEAPWIGPDYCCGWGDCSCHEWDHPKATFYAFIYDALTNANYYFSPWLPVSERNIGEGMPVQEHNPSSFWGKGDIWEHYPDMVLHGGSDYDAGLPNDSIGGLHAKNLDAMKQATGIDYLYPRILLHAAEVAGRASNRFNEYLPKLDSYKDAQDYREIMGYDISLIESGTLIYTPADPDISSPLQHWLYNRHKLPACTTVPAYLAASDNRPLNPSYDIPCSYQRETKTPDRFESGQFGNDSYFTAKQINWGKTDELTIDKGYSNSFSYPFATYYYSESSYGFDPNIYRGCEYDYYYLDNPESYDIGVRARFKDLKDSKEGSLFVDGGEYWGRATDNTLDLIASGAGRSKHVIMVTGAVSDYTLTVHKLPKAYDVNVETDEDMPVNITLNGSSPEGIPVTYSIVNNPRKGSIAGAPPNLIYTPYPNYNGQDFIEYKVSDGSFESLNKAKVTIDIKPMLDPIIAYSQSLKTFENLPIDVTVSATDPDMPSNVNFNFKPVIQPLHGTLSWTPYEAHIRYAPNHDFVGLDSFTFTAARPGGQKVSEQATIEIDVLSDSPVADSQHLTTMQNTPLHIILTATAPADTALYFKLLGLPSNGTISGYVAGQPNLIYTPNTDYTGDDKFSFSVESDIGSSLPAWIDIRVLPSNETAKPDLIIESLTHAPKNPTTIDTMTFTAIVINVGNVEARLSTLNFKIGGETVGADFIIPILGPSASYKVQRRIFLRIAQHYLSTVTVDSKNEVAEEREDNNQRNDDFVVTRAND